MPRSRKRPVKALRFEQLETREFLSVTPYYFAAASYAAGLGGVIASGTSSIFGTGVGEAPVGQFASVDAGGVGAGVGFGGFGVPGSAADAGPAGFGAIGGGAGALAQSTGGTGAFGGALDQGTLANTTLLEMEFQAQGTAGLFASLGSLGSLDAAQNIERAIDEIASDAAGAHSTAEPSFADGVGQMILATGDNTLGMRSFAVPVAGFGSGIVGGGAVILGGGSGTDEESPPLFDDSLSTPFDRGVLGTLRDQAPMGAAGESPHATGDSKPTEPIVSP